jgi:predicted GNAT family acetyltransferase
VQCDKVERHASTFQLDRHVAIAVAAACSVAILSGRHSNEAITMTIRDNKERHRFELDVEGSIAFANYRVTPDAVIITHTETPNALRGRGIASELVKGALALIRAEQRKVIAGCSFVVDYLEQHPEDSDLIA